jgi:5-methyltetrahydropteroyltriglutamate--homocysteine methyltransferase
MLQVDDAVLMHEYDSILSQGARSRTTGAGLSFASRRSSTRCEGCRRIDPLPRLLRQLARAARVRPAARRPDRPRPEGSGRYYLIEQGNPRHEHEWRIWEDVKLPEGKVLVPGVVTHHTTVVEHPEVVAERLVRLAKVVGRESVMGGTDCGFAQGAFIQRVHPTIQWAKLEALAEGARLATEQLWP